MTVDELSTSRAQLRARLGSGARFDSPAAPHGALSAMRRARAGCTRGVMLTDDKGLERPETAQPVAEVACLARFFAEGLERLVGHVGLEGGVAERAEDLKMEVASASILPGRALRALYLHALQHLDVALRDLVENAWRAPFALHNLDVATAEDAVLIMTETLHKCCEELGDRVVPATKSSSTSDFGVP